MKRAFSIRIDSTKLATIAEFYEAKDRAPASLSALVARAVDDFASVLVSSKKTIAITTDEAACETFEKLGYTERSERAKRTSEALDLTLLEPAKPLNTAKLDAVRARLREKGIS